jgi:hypothetical protein
MLLSMSVMVVKKRFHPSVWKDVMLEIAKVIGTPEIEKYIV